MQWSGYSSRQELVLAHVKKLGALRAAHPALRRGARTSLWSDADAMVYKMTSGGDTVYVAVNRSDSAKSVSGLPGGALHDEIGGGTVNGPSVSGPARSSLVLTP